MDENAKNGLLSVLKMVFFRSGRSKIEVFKVGAPLRALRFSGIFHFLEGF